MAIVLAPRDGPPSRSSTALSAPQSTPQCEQNWPSSDMITELTRFGEISSNGTQSRFIPCPVRPDHSISVETGGTTE